MSFILYSKILDPCIPASNHSLLLSSSHDEKDISQWGPGGASITQSNHAVVTTEKEVACGQVLRNKKIKEFFFFAVIFFFFFFHSINLK